MSQKIDRLDVRTVEGTFLVQADGITHVITATADPGSHGTVQIGDSRPVRAHFPVSVLRVDGPLPFVEIDDRRTRRARITEITMK